MNTHTESEIKLISLDDPGYERIRKEVIVLIEVIDKMLYGSIPDIVVPRNMTFELQKGLLIIKMDNIMSEDYTYQLEFIQDITPFQLGIIKITLEEYEYLILEDEVKELFVEHKKKYVL